MTTDSKKTKALDLAITQIDRQFGKGSIMRMGADHVSISENVISTGCLSLDVALGVGGVPRGRIIEVFGPESSGKTTLALHIVAEAQKTGGYAAFIDAEHAMDPEYAKNLGINLDELLVSQPDSGEQSLEIAETLVRSDALDIPLPYIMSNSVLLNGGATLFFTIFTRVRLPTISEPSLRLVILRISILTEE